MRVAVSLALQRHGGAGFEKLTKAKKAGGMLEVRGGKEWVGGWVGPGLPVRH